MGRSAVPRRPSTFNSLLPVHHPSKRRNYSFQCNFHLIVLNDFLQVLELAFSWVG